METAESVAKAFDLSGRVAVVTGGGSGLGRSAAEMLAGQGAAVLIADLDETSASLAAEAISSIGGTALGVGADVARRADHEAIRDAAIEMGGRLDVWVNSAGISVESKVLDIEEADLDALLSVNLKGALFGCQVAGRHMVDAGSGSIINLSSSSVLVASPNVAAYSMTKAGVIQLTRIMALEVGKRGVRVNAIAPGFVPTKITSRFWTRDDGSVDEDMKSMVLEQIEKFAPLRRVGEPSDIGYAVLYLASDASSYVTGQTLAPNGGVAMQ